MNADQIDMSSLERGLLFFDSLSHDEWQTSQSLARQLGVKNRTVKTYAALFKSYGWPVISQSGRGRGYKLEALGADSVRFTSRELFSLAILLAQGTSNLPALEAEKLRSKLKSLLPDAFHRQVSDLEDLIAVQGFAPKDWQLVEDVGRCLSDRRYSLLLDYQGSADSEVRRRHILPVRIRWKDSSCYLDLFDLDKKQHRSFRFDRVSRSSLILQQVPHPEPPEGTFESHKWDFGSGTFEGVTLEITHSLAQWLIEKPEHPSQTIERRDNLVFVHFKIRRLELFADWVLSLRGARVLENDKLKEIVGERIRAWSSERGSLGIPWEK